MLYITLILGEQSPIVLTLPDGVKVNDLKWISVWCRRFAINFGDFIFPPSKSQDSKIIDRLETTTQTGMYSKLFNDYIGHDRVLVSVGAIAPMVFESVGASTHSFW